jgi:ribosome maturation factor RimP
MADFAALTDMIEAEAKAEGLELVRVKMMGGTSDPTLQVMAERPDTRQLTLDDCASAVAALVGSARRAGGGRARSDPGAYRLEVSSPGIDRPLTRLRDFDDWKGHEARITLAEKLNGRKQFNGSLLGIEGDEVLVEVAGAWRGAASVRGYPLGQARHHRQTHSRRPLRSQRRARTKSRKRRIVPEGQPNSKVDGH